MSELDELVGFQVGTRENIRENKRHQRGKGMQARVLSCANRFWKLYGGKANTYTVRRVIRLL